MIENLSTLPGGGCCRITRTIPSAAAASMRSMRICASALPRAGKLQMGWRSRACSGSPPASPGTWMTNRYELRSLTRFPSPLMEPSSLIWISRWIGPEPGIGSAPKPNRFFSCTARTGRRLPASCLSIDPNRTRFNRSDIAFPKARKVNSVAVSLAVPIPALGYTCLTARAGKKDPSPAISRKSTLSATGCSLANELLRVDIEPNGSLTLSDLRTGRSYRPLMVFEDSGDIGNGYNYRAPASNQVITSAGCQADIALIREGPCLASIRIHSLLRIPAEFDFETMRRASRMDGSSHRQHGQPAPGGELPGS